MTAEARAQYALVDAWTALARANGVNADLDTALAAADHGDRTAALRAARAEWDRRADRAHGGRPRLGPARQRPGRRGPPVRPARHAPTGYRNASFLYHRGMIERATGHDRKAPAPPHRGPELNPGFSPLGAREARTALKALEAAK